MPSGTSSGTRDWFWRRTWHHSVFPAADLLADKARTGATIAVVLPARNEASTVGTIVTTLREQLIERHPLVDELVVVDGDSDDDTALVAEKAGARVVHQADVLPEAGTAPGKGEALWKGLAATTSDLIVYVDADLHDLDERFVTGLVGPLLRTPEVHFVKATYDRPFVVDGAVQPWGGGRVTELMARPLIATFWPELAGLAQPLSGEYAGRRELLESVPFVQGYGVELGLLIDVLDCCGIDAIGQVDLGRRIHEHQTLAALSRMSTEILHVAVQRLQREGRLEEGLELGWTLDQPVRDPGTGRLDLVEHGVQVGERPPLAEWRRRSTS